MVGLDAGIAKLATLSDGTVFEPVNSFKTNQTKLARLQRQLSKKVKFSSNWKKQKPRSSGCTHISPIPAAITLHKVTTTISKTTR
jgi:putative transposase